MNQCIQMRYATCKRIFRMYLCSFRVGILSCDGASCTLCGKNDAYTSRWTSSQMEASPCPQWIGKFRDKCARYIIVRWCMNILKRCKCLLLWISFLDLKNFVCLAHDEYLVSGAMDGISRKLNVSSFEKDFIILDIDYIALIQTNE